MSTPDPSAASDRPSRRFHILTEAAEVLATSQAQVSVLVRTGELPAIKIGGRGQWRIEASALEDWIARQYEQTKQFVAANPLSDSSGRAGAAPYRRVETRSINGLPFRRWREQPAVQSSASTEERGRA